MHFVYVTAFLCVCTPPTILVDMVGHPVCERDHPLCVHTTYPLGGCECLSVCVHTTYRLGGCGGPPHLLQPLPK